jgi:hypothetical protein
MKNDKVKVANKKLLTRGIYVFFFRLCMVSFVQCLQSM